MASALGEVKHNAERAALGTLIDGIFKDLKNKENKRESYIKMAHLAQKYFGKEAFSDEKMAQVEAYLRDPDARWAKFIGRVVDEVNPNFAKMTLLNLGY